MRLWTIASTGCGVVLVVVSAVFAGDPANGKAIYEKNCVICHGAQGRGDGPGAAMVRPKPTNFASPESRKKSDAELLKTIESGSPGTPMAPWKEALSPQQIQDVLAYVRSLGR